MADTGVIQQLQPEGRPEAAFSDLESFIEFLARGDAQPVDACLHREAAAGEKPNQEGKKIHCRDAIAEMLKEWPAGRDSAQKRNESQQKQPGPGAAH
jgi:hypothetical protein